MYALDCVLKTRPTAAVWDLVSGLLYQFHSQGIEEGEEPAPEGEAALHTANEFELALEPGILAPPERFSAYFDNLRDAEHAQRAIEPVLVSFVPRFVIREVEEKNYAELWKDNFQPLAIAPNWHVRASWHEPAPKGVNELIIEPGMAFGTGSHETTRACLELIAEAVSSGKLGAKHQVLDFGCGSGILSIGLKKLGIGTVYSIDIDPLAIEASQRNAALNHFELKTSLEAPKLNALDGIVANILKNTLLDFAPSFQTWLRPGGFLILSGLLAEQEQIILDRYLELGFKVKKKLSNNNWVSFSLQKGKN
ncbi:MAG: 50S ribosomal protein L11 methyltransferase [Bdellovibrionota bacterium]